MEAYTLEPHLIQYTMDKHECNLDMALKIIELEERIDMYRAVSSLARVYDLHVEHIASAIRDNKIHSLDINMTDQVDVNITEKEDRSPFK